MVENFWKMKAFSIFTVPYAYVDHFSYLAEGVSKIIGYLHTSLYRV